MSKDETKPELVALRPVLVGEGRGANYRQRRVGPGEVLPTAAAIDADELVAVGAAAWRPTAEIEPPPTTGKKK